MAALKLAVRFNYTTNISKYSNPGYPTCRQPLVKYFTRTLLNKKMKNIFSAMRVEGKTG
jgi:hypothetical protein